MTMMKAILTIALTLAITIALTSHITKPVKSQGAKETSHEDHKSFVGPKTLKIRMSRFLAEEKNPRAADHCHKDGEVCAATNTTCCNNKCINLQYDYQNCGACKAKCKLTQVCCRGQCVHISFDKRHCGSCNNKCVNGGLCIYGICDYA